MKKAANCYTVCLPLGIVCTTASKEDISKEVDAILNDFLESHSSEEITAILATDIEGMELYRGLYTLLEQAIAVDEIRHAQIYNNLIKQNEELKDALNKKDQEISHLKKRIKTLEVKEDDIPKERLPQYNITHTKGFFTNLHQEYTITPKSTGM